MQNLFYRRYQTKNAQTFGALCQTFWRDTSRDMSLCSSPVWCYRANAVRRIRESRVKRRLPRRHGRALLHAARRRATCSCQFQSQIVVRVKCAAIEDFKKNGRRKYIPIPMQSIPFCPREAFPLQTFRFPAYCRPARAFLPQTNPGNPELNRNKLPVSATSGGFRQVLTAFGGYQSRQSVRPTRRRFLATFGGSSTFWGKIIARALSRFAAFRLGGALFCHNRKNIGDEVASVAVLGASHAV